MLSNLVKATFALTIFLGSTGVFALENSSSYDFSQLDQKYHNRHDFPDTTQQYEYLTQLRQEYFAVAAQQAGLSTRDKVYAMSQVGRIDLFIAGIISSIPLETQKQVLNRCIRDIQAQIGNTNTQEFYYFYIACVALRGKKASTDIERANYGVMMSNIQEAALEATKVNGQLVGGYEGGGILRIFSAIRGNLKADPLGLYNPTEGKYYAGLALKTQTTTIPPYTEALSGKQFYENYYYYGQAVVAVGLEMNNDQGKEEVNQGNALLKKIVQFIESKGESLTPERKSERNYYKRIMTELSQNIDYCMNRPNWADCLRTKLQ